MNSSTAWVGGGVRKTVGKPLKEPMSHEEWLTTPEGIKHVRMAELLQQQRAEAEAKLQEERKREKMWMDMFGELLKLPAVGEIIKPRNPFGVRVEPGKKQDHGLVAYGLLIVMGTYPSTPVPFRTMSQAGRKGLKVFFNKTSRDRMEKIDHEAFDMARNGQMGYLSVENLKVRIIAHSKTGMSVHAELVE